MVKDKTVSENIILLILSPLLVFQTVSIFGATKTINRFGHESYKQNRNEDMFPITLLHIHY